MTSPLPERIGVTVIGGFLGAGKTTLVNHLIRTSSRRLGVIVNEFGTAGVDGQLIQALTDDVPRIGVDLSGRKCERDGAYGPSRSHFTAAP